MTAVLDETQRETEGSSTKTPGSLDELRELARSLGVEFDAAPGVPRHGDEAVRALAEGWELRAASDQSSLGTLTGLFAVFNRWTEIDSFWEGRFLEQIAPGAFDKTFSESGPAGSNSIRCLFQHGRDPQIGMKPLGPVRTLESVKDGANYEVPLDDTSYNRDLLPGLKNDLYGASFRFQVIREEVNTKPGTSTDNPEGIEERTITECKVREFGPVTFGAYEDATAGIRSLNDEIADAERFRMFVDKLRDRSRGISVPAEVRSEDDAPAPPAASTETAPPREAPDRLNDGSTLKPGAATLRTSRSKETPPWQI